MIELKGVTAQYFYGNRVLGAADFAVADGEILAVLGGEGSGKTTLLKAIAEVTDHEGEVLINGSPLSKRPDDVLMVFDDLAVFKNRTFFYNLAYPLKIRGYDKNEIYKRVTYAAERAGVLACLHDRVKKSSLIDVKRLAIARLFIRDYKALLIDDITSGLSENEAEEIFEELAPVLKQKASEGVSIIYSTTSRREAERLSDRIAVMHYGELKMIDAKERIYLKPNNIWAAQALDKYYHFERAEIKDEGGLYLVLEGGYTLNAECLRGKFLQSYIGKTVFAGWHSEDFDFESGRKERVEYTTFEEGSVILHTASGIKAKGKVRNRISTLPKVEKCRLYDFASENSIMTEE